MSQTGLVQAIFLVCAMTTSGVAHIFWLNSRLAREFSWPIDGGLTFRGQRIFGDNKRVAGFVALPLATGVSFVALQSLRQFLPTSLSNALWPLTAWQYCGLGLACGLAFMVAELPNSFVKRQLGIEPGALATRLLTKRLTLFVDRFDSVFGCLLVLSLLVPVPSATWVWVLGLGSVTHALFSAAMYRLGLKRRAL